MASSSSILNLSPASSPLAEPPPSSSSASSSSCSYSSAFPRIPILSSSLSFSPRRPPFPSVSASWPTSALRLSSGLAYHNAQPPLSSLIPSFIGHHSRPLSSSSSSSFSFRPCTAQMAESVPSAAASRKSDEYNRVMQRQMRNPYEYHHDLGMYYTRILDRLIVGSQPQNTEDVNRLYNEEGVRAILNLQQDKDIEYWGIDFKSIRKCCDDLGIQYLRAPAQDFDPYSLRCELPKAVSLLEAAISSGLTVYVHCTAGLGRAPAVAIAYLFWFQGMNLEAAYAFLTAKRPCGPRKESIRAATYDLAKNDPWKEPLEQLPGYAFTDVAPWERQLIQERIRGLRNVAQQ